LFSHWMQGSFFHLQMFDPSPESEWPMLWVGKNDLMFSPFLHSLHSLRKQNNTKYKYHRVIKIIESAIDIFTPIRWEDCVTCCYHICHAIYIVVSFRKSLVWYWYWYDTPKKACPIQDTLILLLYDGLVKCFLTFWGSSQVQEENFLSYCPVPIFQGIES